MFIGRAIALFALLGGIGLPAHETLAQSVSPPASFDGRYILMDSIAPISGDCHPAEVVLLAVKAPVAGILLRRAYVNGSARFEHNTEYWGSIDATGNVSAKVKSSGDDKNLSASATVDAQGVDISIVSEDPFIHKVCTYKTRLHREGEAKNK
jgi:hypothetical protein